MVLQGISAGGDGNISPAEKHADELMLDISLAFWELLENPNARKVIHELLEETHLIHVTETSAYMMVGVTQQLKDTLIDEHKGALSVKYIVDAIIKWSIEPKFTEIIEKLYQVGYKLVLDPNLPKLLNKLFDFLEAVVKTHRGAELIAALANGVCEITEKPDTKKKIITAFEHGKQLISTPMSSKVKNFLSGK